MAMFETKLVEEGWTDIWDGDYSSLWIDEGDEEKNVEGYWKQMRES
jgi:hypothetical protein